MRSLYNEGLETISKRVPNTVRNHKPSKSQYVDKSFRKSLQNNRSWNSRKSSMKKSNWSKSPSEGVIRSRLYTNTYKNKTKIKGILKKTSVSPFGRKREEDWKSNYKSITKDKSKKFIHK